MHPARDERGLPLAFIAAGAMLAFAAPANGDENPTIRQIAAAWRHRAAQIKSGDIQWTESRVMVQRHKFSGGAFGSSDGAAPDGAGEIPTIEHEFKRQYVFAGEKYRYFNSESVWHPSVASYLPLPMTHAFDGSTYMSLTDQDLPDSFRYQGTVAGGDVAQLIYGLIDIMPLLLHFQPFLQDPEFLSGYTVTDQAAVAEGARCVVLQRVKDSFGRPVTKSLWLDPNAGFAIRRILSESGGRVNDQLDITYRSDPVHGPVPQSWKRVDFRSGKFDRSAEATVTQSSLNESLPSDVFQLEFPVNTLVVDATKGNAQPDQYLVRPGDERRVVLREELRRAKSAQEIIESDTGHAGLVDRPTKWPFLWIVCVVGALLLIGVVVFTKRTWMRR